MNTKKKLSLILGATLVGCAAFGPLGLLALLAVFLNFEGVGPVLGASYPKIATTSSSGYSNEVREQLWVDRVLDSNGASHQDTPFADAMTGRIKVGKPASNSQLMKAVVEISDTSKVRGDTINIFSTAGVGGEGATGDAERLGTEAQIVTGNMQVKIGNQLFAVGYKQSTVDKSMIGLAVTKNQRLNDDLRKLHNKRKNDTIIWRMLAAAGYGASGFVGQSGTSPNLLYPSGISGREALRSTHTVDLPLIMYAGDYLPGLGAQPMDTTQDSGGSVGELYMFLSPDKALYDLEADPQLTQVLQYGWDRGQNNPIFAGGFAKVRGHGLYRWIHRDHANYDNIGSPLLPRARLSVATTNTDAQDIRGGGNLSGALSDNGPQWFKHFSNAPVEMYGGVENIGTINNPRGGTPNAGTTGQTRYLMVIGSGGYSVWRYTVNNGNKITTSVKHTDVPSTASTPYVHSVGDLIVECNSAGQAFGRSLMFGAQAVVGGMGSINGNPVNPQNGRLVQEVRDLGNDISIGVEGCAGYAAVKRAGDNAYPGFVVVEHAVTVPGAPTT